MNVQLNTQNQIFLLFTKIKKWDVLIKKRVFK